MGATVTYIQHRDPSDTSTDSADAAETQHELTTAGRELPRRRRVNELQTASVRRQPRRGPPIRWIQLSRGCSGKGGLHSGSNGSPVTDNRPMGVLAGGHPQEQRMIGRDESLRQLERACDVGSVALVVGEAGVGKTRLVVEYEQRVLQHGTSVLVGGCVELLGEHLPYGPIAEILRQLKRRRSSIAAGSPISEDLVRSLDALLGPNPIGPRDRAEQFEGVLTFFADLLHVCERLVIVIEDVHWADRATLDMLVFLARNLPSACSLVLTCREERVDTDRELLTFWSALHHSKSIMKIELARLDRDQIAELIAERCKFDTASLDVDEVFVRSEGNPLIALELVASPSIGVLPLSLHDMLLARSARLGADAQLIVGLLAVLGRQVDYGIICSAACSASGLSKADLRSALHEAVQCGMLIVGGDRDSYRFRHALTRDAVLGLILPGERRPLHALAAQAIEDQPGVASSARLAAEAATHWYAADVPGPAYLAAIRAGRLAAAVFAYAESWRHFKQALHLAETLPPPAQDPSLEGKDGLYVEAAEAARWAGDLQEAIRLVTAARDHARQGVQRGELGERVARYLSEGGRTADAAAEYDAARKELRGQCSQVAAKVAASSAHIRILMGHYREAIPLAKDAIRVAARARAPLQSGRARITLGMALMLTGSLADGERHVRSGHAIVVRLGDLDERRRAHSNLAYALMMCGDTPGACEAAMSGYTLLQRYGLEGRAGAAVIGNLIALLWLAGRWEEATQLSDDFESRGIPDSEARHLLLARAYLHNGRGELDAAAACLRRATPPTETGSAQPALTADILAARGLLAVETGDLSTAKILLVQAATTITAEHTMLETRICRIQLRIAADIIENGTPEPNRVTAADPDAAAIHQRLEASRRASPSPEVLADAVTADAEYTRCLLHSDPANWQQAIQAWERIGRPFDIAYCCWRCAEALLNSAAAGHKSVAPLLQRAYQLATELGAGPLQQRIQDVARRSRTTLQPDVTAPPKPPSTLAAQLGITPRETEVLRCLLSGRTNREIAQRLYISERTAGVHVGHIIAKLGVSRRGQAAAAASRLGLASYGEDE